MRIVVQVVSKAQVKLATKVVSEIKSGYLLLVAIKADDTQEIAAKAAEKIRNLRIFPDENGKMNLDIVEAKGEILSVSQFTLYADLTTGRRPSFIKNASAVNAKELYEYFNECLRNHGLIVKTGVFQEIMQVSLTNEGPVTVILESEEFSW